MQRPDPTAIVVGKDAADMPVSLPLRSRLEHALILGSTGSGKSRLLLHFMRQAVKRGEGLLFLDPHGGHPDSIYRDLIIWLSRRDRSLHVIDLNAPNVIGFNPLFCPPGTDPSVIAGNVMDALAISWEGESFAQKPSIERVLSAVLIALVEMKLTLCDAPLLLDHDDAQGLRKRAIETVQDPYTRDELKRLDDLAKDGRRMRDFDQETIGPRNRFARLLRPPVLRQMLGRSGLDLRAVMDEGGIVLANLSGGASVYKRDTDLLGRLLTRTALFEAERRRNSRPFSIVLDEAHRFLSPDIPILLAEVRKYGISVVAAMQWLEQAGDEHVRAALLNVNCKICFRLRDAKESEALARSVIPLDLERPIATLVKPAVVGHRRITLANQSRGENKSDSTGNSRGETRGRAATNGSTIGHMHAEGSSWATSEGTSDSEGTTSGNSENATQIMLPIMEDGIFAPDPFITRVAEGSGNSSGSSSGSSRSSSTTEGSSIVDAETYSRTTSETESFAASLATSESHSQGTTETIGHGEALEPILANLPTAVHGIQNELYRAGLMLRSLPTAVGYLSYVGRYGPVATLFTVPPVFTAEVTEEAFSITRDRFLPPPVPPQPISPTPPVAKPARNRGKPGW